MNMKDAGKLLIEFANQHLEETVSNVVRKTASTIHANIVVGTPIKTGKARSNWVLSLGAPTSIVIPTHGITESISETLAEAEVVIRRHKTGDSIYITNSVDYIVSLNEGSSKQAPAGFVEGAVLIAGKTVANLYPQIIKGLK